jgi:hypothetical protein
MELIAWEGSFLFENSLIAFPQYRLWDWLMHLQDLQASQPPFEVNHFR